MKRHMSKILFTRGLQGSGKSTWAKQFCIDNPDWVRVSRDDLRTMRGQYWRPKDEGMISKIELDAIVSALKFGKNVIVDAMNLNYERDIIGKLDQIAKADVFVSHQIKDFTDVPLEECIKNDLKRPNSVGEKVIRKTYNKYLAPEPVKYEEDPSLPSCIIVDIDGTLAKMNGRSPYDWDRVGEDSVNLPVASIVEDYRKVNRNVIIFTGRDGSCYDATKEWLFYNGIPWDELHSRGEGDNRKDSIVKREMFEKYIRGRYYVDFVLDDRDQVVDMWRKELGLTCLQVDYGDF